MESRRVHSATGSSWRPKDREKARGLWLDCLLLAHLVRRPETPEIDLFRLADVAYAAAYAALDWWASEECCRSLLQADLERTLSFLQALKPRRDEPGVGELRARLLRAGGQGEMRQEIWSYLLGHWLYQRSASPVPEQECLVETGWAIASFGLNFWTGGPVHYKERGARRLLCQPYSRSDAYELLGPLEVIRDGGSVPDGAKLILGAVSPARGLQSPRIWQMEACLGGLAGVSLTRAGHVHRQFAALDLPEWFEAVEVTYDPGVISGRTLLTTFWANFFDAQDIVFYTDEQQRLECSQAWIEFSRSQPRWSVPEQLQVYPCNWFDVAPLKDQKQSLRQLSILHRALVKVDLRHSPLATKLNAFAGGYGSDEEVVLLAARYRLSAVFTQAIRIIRFFQSLLRG